MTLDEEIKHAEEVANTNERLCKTIQPAMQLSDYGKCAEEHKQLAEWLKELKQLREQTEWIPVSEKLPNIHNCSMKYLVTDCHRHVHTSLFTECNGKHWWTYENVIAWMPSPTPYKPD